MPPDDTSDNETRAAADIGGTSSALVNSFNNSITSILNDGEKSLREPQNGLPTAQEAAINPGRSRKRQKIDTTRKEMSYPRRRAVTACQLCRVRKTKCNNERPVCSSCSALGADCQYEDRSDHSSFDPASLLILQRLNEIISRLDTTVPPAGISPLSMPSQEATYTSRGGRWSIQAPEQDSSDQGTASHETRDNTDHEASAFDYLKVHSSRATPDSILSWPVFEGQFGPECLIQTLFVPEKADAALSEESPPQNQRPDIKDRRLTRGMHDEDAPGLVNRFLTYVHTKNPILDVRTIKEYARRVSENGPQWDAPSCLVLLACALGTIAKPFDSSPVPPTMQHAGPISVDIDGDARQTAETYYNMARKRFGLLDRTIITSQCYLLSGVYLMYTIQPLRAWNDFLQASINYHIYLKCQMANNTRLTYLHPENESRTRRLEQRLYWTCFKSECEIRAEMSLPESGISDLRYPYMFPSPPSPGSPIGPERTLQENTSITSESPQSTSTLTHSISLDQSQQQSWFYYLTEISLRRIGNRIMNAYYQGDHSSWANMNVPEMTKIAEQFETQLSEWYDGLPEPISYSREDFEPLDELQYLVKARMLEMKTWLYRPFLYYVIHHSAYNEQSMALAQPFAEKALKTGSQKVEATAIRHRHHGTWYSCRVSATCALTIIAAKKSGRVSMPPNWDTFVRRSMDALAYWEKESPDIAETRRILQLLVDQMHI